MELNDLISFTLNFFYDSLSNSVRVYVNVPLSSPCFTVFFPLFRMFYIKTVRRRGNMNFFRNVFIKN